MTIHAGMPSYFWLVSPRLKKPVQDDVPYTTEALNQDLLRLQIAWDDCQASRARDAIYGYLSAVFNLVGWWRLKTVLLNALAWRCCYAALFPSTTKSRLPQ
jgi:hypothetical protein